MLRHKQMRTSKNASIKMNEKKAIKAKHQLNKSSKDTFEDCKLDEGDETDEEATTDDDTFSNES